MPTAAAAGSIDPAADRGAARAAVLRRVDLAAGRAAPAAADLMKNPVDGFSAGLVDDSNLFEWQVTIIGPQDTL